MVISHQKVNDAALKARSKPKQWKKECICLRYCRQESKPSSEEKIKLARIGLGLKEVVFDANGDVESIHNSLMDKYPVLESCGGYSLLRLAENSHKLLEIDGPDGGMSVPFLKDVLNQAKLYIRPLQNDILLTEEDTKNYTSLVRFKSG